MKYVCTVISVADIKAARKFYEDLFSLEVYQDYGRNIAFTCGLALGQRVIRFYDLDGHIIEVGEDMKMVIKRFFATGMTMEEVSVKMDASVEDLTRLLNS